MTNNNNPGFTPGGHDYGEQEPGLNRGEPLPQYSGPQQPTYSYDNPGVALVQGNGSPRVWASLKKSFSLFGKSAGSWIGYCALAALCIIVVMVVLGVITGFASLAGGGIENGELSQPSLVMTTIINVLSSAVTAVAGVYLYNGALQAAEGRDLTFSKFFALKHGFAKPFLVIFILQLVMAVLQTIFDAGKPAVDTATLNANSAGASMFALSTSQVAAGAACAVVLLLAYPLFTLVGMYSLDHGFGVGEAYARCFADSGRNYLKLLGANIVLSIMVGISALFLLVPLLVTVPVMAICYAMLYRQISRGQHVAV